MQYQSTLVVTFSENFILIVGNLHKLACLRQFTCWKKTRKKLNIKDRSDSNQIHRDERVVSVSLAERI